MNRTLIHANEATAAQRRVYFDLRDATDGITAETGEAGGQPQISTNGAAWTNTGIGTLTHIGSGRYYADLTQAAVATAGDLIETRYKSAATAESPGDSVQVTVLDLTDAAGVGLSRLDAAISGIAATVWSYSTLIGQSADTYGAYVQNLIARLGDFAGTGINTVKGFLRAIAAKAASLTPSELSAGTTYDNTTDSNEAIKDGGVASVAGAVGSVTGAVGSVTGNVGGNVTGSVGSLAAQAKADVNAEVVDVIRVDTLSELGVGAPVATPTVATALMLLYMALRNAGQQTSGEFRITNDAGTVICEGDTSDDGTTYIRAKLGAPD